MPRVPFEELPDHGRLWVFPASRDLTDEEAASALGEVDAFLEAWKAHGVPLRAGRDLAERHFLLVGVDVDAEAPSGCSIDALVNRLRALGTDLGVQLIDHASVWYREEGRVRAVARAEFRRLVAEGGIAADVRVFDTTLTTVGQLRAGALERPATETWHRKTFFGSAARG
jgi:hypothetical protein